MNVEYEFTLGDAFDLQMGKTPVRDNPLYWGGRNKWVAIADIQGRTISETKECISDLAVKETKIKVVPKGTLIMSFKLSVGKVAFTAEDMYTNEAIMAFIDKGKYPIDMEYLFHYLGNQDWRKGTNKAVKGLTLNKKTLSAQQIRLPSLTTQREVAHTLNLLDRAIQLCQHLLDAMGSLVQSRFVEMFGDPVENPHSYEKVDLSELADIKIGPFGTLLHKHDYIEGGHPIVNPAHIVDGKIVTNPKLTITAEKYEEMSAYHLQRGDVVMGRRGEMGRCAVVDKDGLLCGTGSLLIRTKGDVTADYIQKIISFPSFKKTIEDMAVGQTMQNLNVPIVSGFQIIKPPMEIQEHYYTFVAQADRSKVSVIRCLKKAEYLKSALMQQYFG